MKGLELVTFLYDKQIKFIEPAKLGYRRFTLIYKLIILIILFLIAFSGITKAQTNNDHLEPVGGIFDIYDFQFEYYSKVRKVLFKDLSDKPEIRFLTMPSFTSENVLQIDYDREKSNYYCIYHICESMIWNNKNWENVTVKKYSRAIEKQSVELIKSLYDLAISQTKFYKDETIGVDGANYYFSIDKQGQKSGTVWSPNDNTRMAELIAISCELIKKTKEQNDHTIIVFDNDFRERIKKLMNLLLQEN
jgi:hypothetical protein